MLPVFLLLFASTAVGISALEENCGICDDLSLCESKGLADKCDYLVEVGVQDADVEVIVDIHNQLRAQVSAGNETRGIGGPQPGARNMMTMTWDSALARVAQLWADQCMFAHDACRHDPRFRVGQNVAIFYSNRLSARAWQAAARLWYDEVELFDKKYINPFKYDDVYGHYTQVVWASTSLIGCGFSYFKVDGVYNALYVCNYGPAGNWLNGTMYEVEEDGTDVSNENTTAGNLLNGTMNEVKEDVTDVPNENTTVHDLLNEVEEDGTGVPTANISVQLLNEGA